MRVFKQEAFQSYLKKISIFVFTFSIASCSTYYIPTTQNVPLFEEKNELQLYGGFALGQASLGGDVQAAYSIADHFAVTASGYFGSVDGRENNSGSSGNPYRKGDLSVGYFTKLGESKGIFEIYGGWGSGGVAWKDPFLKDVYHFNQFFVQPNIGADLGPVDLAFSTRVNYTTWNGREDIFFEPAFTIRAGGDRAMFQFQISGCVSTETIGGTYNYNSDFDQFNFDNYEKFHMSFGLFVPINLNKNK